MDEAVERGLARWPGIPDVYGWLRLDRRGNWLIRDPATGAFGRIGNAALNGFIARNYGRDGGGRWFFQNGPQRVFVALDYTPLVARLEDGRCCDQCGRLFDPVQALLDDEGSVLLAGHDGVALLDDRDLLAFASHLGEDVERLPRIPRDEVPARFRFVAEPAP